MCAACICLVSARYSGNRTESIQHCYNVSHNYIQVIASRVDLEDDKCVEDYNQNQQEARNNMIVKIGELLTKVEEVKTNLQFSGSIYQVLEQLSKVVRSL